MFPCVPSNANTHLMRCLLGQQKLEEYINGGGGESVAPTRELGQDSDLPPQSNG